jgi:hypothetical protein
VQRGFSPRYLATSKSAGHLIYVDLGTLFAVPFDPNRMEPLGTPVPIFEDVAQATGSAFAQFDVSSEGSLVYLRSNAAGLPLRTVQWLDATGKMDPLISKPGVYFSRAFHPMESASRCLSQIVSKRKISGSTICNVTS